MEAMNELEGATLDDVTVDWRNGIVRITFLPAHRGDEAHAIRATEFTRVEVPRGGAGASRIVKSVRREGQVTELVMQSGETLRVEAEDFAVDVLGG